MDVIAHEQGEHTAPSHLSPPLYPYGLDSPLSYTVNVLWGTLMCVCSLSPFNLVTRALCIVITKTDWRPVMALLLLFFRPSLTAPDYKETAQQQQQLFFFLLWSIGKMTVVQRKDRHSMPPTNRMEWTDEKNGKFHSGLILLKKGLTSCPSLFNIH